MKKNLGELGFAGRPDASGIRGHGLDRPLLKRSPEYPYDDPVTYGQPAAYDRGSGGQGQCHQPLTPKDTEHSAWDDIEEASGTPMAIGKSGSAQTGASQGVPGAGGGWANAPSKPWDEAEITAKELERFGESIPSNFTQGAKFPEPDTIPNEHSVENDEEEVRDGALFKQISGDRSIKKNKNDASDVMVLGTDRQFGNGFGHSMRSTRAMGGLTQRESAWDVLERLIRDS